MTFEEMFDIYVRYKLEITGKGKPRCKRVSVYTTERRLTKFLAPVWHQEPRDFAADDLVSLLHAYSSNGKRSTTTVRGCYRETRAMLRWMARKQYVTRDWVQAILESDVVQDALEDYPNESDVGETLTLDEARLFAAAAKAEANENPRGVATGALVALYGALRVNEIITRTARYIDDGGRVVWVDKQNAKTKKMRPAHIEDPEVQALLCTAKAGLGPDDRVFLFTRQAMYDAIQRICKDCGVTQVGCHGLRRTFATLAVADGIASAAVASALGHTSFSMTQKHYVKPGALEQAASSAVNRRLRSV